MELNRHYDYSDYDRNDEKYYSENYLNRHVRKSYSNKILCSKSYYSNIVHQIDEIKKQYNVNANLWEHYYYNPADRYKLISDYEARITVKRLEELLTKLEINDTIITYGRCDGCVVVPGSIVDIRRVTTCETFTYEILTEDKSDLKKGKISYKTPIAHGLFGHTIGDIVEIKVPSGIIKLEILDIR